MKRTNLNKNDKMLWNWSDISEKGICYSLLNSNLETNEAKIYVLGSGKYVSKSRCVVLVKNYTYRTKGINVIKVSC